MQTQVFPSEARKQDLKRKFDQIIQLYCSNSGAHPNLIRELDKVLAPVEKAVHDIEEYQNRRKMRRTWGDHTGITMWLD
ncbi:hypothetical protein BDP27DRAFT_1217960 [Rhodocollybia butyracea]|uniref:Uncharacterized protein n=1 Tax=Rhodocollybia butyracea TaxID=206335 RepID=A0A9P5PTS2_9AGAR|nr:hypothetical protein BDP27DRAFT_1217960 [Rhodocollybia butyracea]